MSVIERLQREVFKSAPGSLTSIELSSDDACLLAAEFTANFTNFDETFDAMKRGEFTFMGIKIVVTE